MVVVTLLRDVLDRGLSVAIGVEHGYEPLASCALVVAPVSVDGLDAGAVGLLGPTRMNYPQALAAAHVVGERLGERIGETLGWPPDGRRRPRHPDGQARGSACRALTRGPTSTSCSACPTTPPTTRSSAPTARRPASCTPTPTAATPTSEARFKEVSLAYEVLRDPERRARYDRFGPEGVFGQGPGAGGFDFDAGLGDLFEAFFGSMGGGAGGGRRRGPQPGRRRRGDARGWPSPRRPSGPARSSRSACRSTCADLRRGAGPRPGTEAVTCPDCQGTGEIRRIRQSLLGQVVTAVACGRCQGLGETIPHPCPDCRGEGRRIEDRTLRRRGARRGRGRLDAAPGRPGPGRPPGRAQRLAVRPPGGGARRALRALAATTCTPRSTSAWPRRRSGPSSRCQTLEEPESGRGGRGHPDRPRRVRLKGLGVPHLRGRGRGDLFVHVVVDTPTDAQRQARGAAARAGGRAGRGGRPPGGGRRRVLAAALRLRLTAAPEPPRRRPSAARRAGGPGRRRRPGVRGRPAPTGRSSRPTGTTWSGSCASARASAVVARRRRRTLVPVPGERRRRPVARRRAGGGRTGRDRRGARAAAHGRPSPRPRATGPNGSSRS